MVKLTFLTPRYSAVVPENSEPGTLVTQIKAEDPDMGAAGTVHYALADADIGNSRLYRIEPATGEIFTKTILTGKGRRAPYVLIVRAIDDGEPQLFTDTEVYITVGDVSSNDGVPAFVSPAAGEAIAYVPENSQPGVWSVWYISWSLLFWEGGGENKDKKSGFVLVFFIFFSFGTCLILKCR